MRNCGELWKIAAFEYELLRKRGEKRRKVALSLSNIYKKIFFCFFVHLFSFPRSDTRRTSVYSRESPTVEDFPPSSSPERTKSERSAGNRVPRSSYRRRNRFRDSLPECARWSANSRSTTPICRNLVFSSFSLPPSPLCNRADASQFARVESLFRARRRRKQCVGFFFAACHWM